MPKAGSENKSTTRPDARPGSEAHRWQSIAGSGRVEDYREFLRDFPHLKVIEAYRRPQFDAQFAIDGEAAVGDSAKIYLVDPDDNLMMHYPAKNDQNRVLEDIKRLMKISQIG